jgi:hypothetical protein
LKHISFSLRKANKNGKLLGFGEHEIVKIKYLDYPDNSLKKEKEVNSNNWINGLMDFLRENLQGFPIIQELELMIQEGTSKAGKRYEEVFTREFLCKFIRIYFYEHMRSELKMLDEDIKSGLGTEGYKNCQGFGFTPAREKKHLLDKKDILKSEPPSSWFIDNPKSLRDFQACPDFAISEPLPISIVGEVKYFKSGLPDTAIKELYTATRQAIFYLGAFNGKYDSAMIVVADASPKHVFHEALQALKPQLLKRFGEETGIYLLTIKLS